MITKLHHQRSTFAYRILSAFIAFTFTFGMVVPPQAAYAQMAPATILNLPAPGMMLPVSQGYAPTLVTGITVHPENPLEFDFMINTGDSNLTGTRLEDESQKLIKYFLASLTVPEEELWVNLSPYEKDRIIPQTFGETEMGRDLLAQDYLLKQLTASLMYPEDELGKKFWDRVYKKAYEQFGTTEIPMNTFNKVWIVPDSALVLEKDASAYVIDSHLKVMLEEDYLALKSNMDNQKFSLNQVLEDDAEVISGVTSEVVREVLIPEIEKEVNEGETFANLRQIYNSMILATWYKQNLKESLLGQVYVDQNKIKGVDVEDKQVKEKIYSQYLEAFKKGVYNYIKEDYDLVTKEIVPRKYFSGGGYFRSLGKDLDKIVPQDLLTRQPTPEQFISFLLLVKEMNNEDYDQIVVPVFQRFSPEEQKYITGQVRIESKNYQSMQFEVNAVLFENLEEGNVELILPKSALEMASSPVNQNNAEALEKMEQQLAYFRQKLGLSDVDVGYFKSLFRKYVVGGKDLRIGKESFIPSAYLKKEKRRSKMAVTSSKEIEGDPANKESARNVTLRVLQMKGGVGSSFKRKRTLKRLRGSEAVADKATDSYFEDVDVPGYDINGKPVNVKDNVSVAELKAQRAIYLQSGKERTYEKIIIEELVNAESQPHVKAFYETPYVLDRADKRRVQARTYRQVIEEMDGLELADMTFQGNYPNIDANTKELIDHKDALTPGGHGFLGTLLLDRIAENAPVDGEAVISTITNGDGVNNFPTPELVGWMHRKRIPIVIISTTRTPLDAKGGVLGLEKVEGGTATQIFEKAQAERAKQFLDEKGGPGLFQELGLTKGEPGGQYFNTNVSVYNETVLHPFLSRLKEILEPEGFFEVTTPDLITNPKKKDIGGEKREIFQLEGAKASALLNLNKFVTTTTEHPEVRALMDEFGFERLVYIVNFDPEGRINVFTPSKFSYDHALYGRSTSFVVDVLRGRLDITEGVDPAALPSFDVDDFLKDLENDYEAFGDQFDAKELKSLHTRGEIVFPNAVLKGELSLTNLSDHRVDLNEYKNKFEIMPDGRLLLNNVTVVITSKNRIIVTDSSQNKYENLPLQGRLLVDSLQEYLQGEGGWLGYQDTTRREVISMLKQMAGETAVRMYGHTQDERANFVSEPSANIILGDLGSVAQNFYYDVVSTTGENPVRFLQILLEGAGLDPQKVYRFLQTKGMDRQQILADVYKAAGKVGQSASSPVTYYAFYKYGGRFLLKADSLEKLKTALSEKGVHVVEGEDQSIDPNTPEGRDNVVIKSYNPMTLGKIKDVVGVGAEIYGATSLALQVDQNVNSYMLKDNEAASSPISDEDRAWRNSYGDLIIGRKGFTDSRGVDHYDQDGFVDNNGVTHIGEKGYVDKQGIVHTGSYGPGRRGSSPVQKVNEKVGGIDLNPELLDLQIKRDGNGIPLPVYQQPIYNMKIDGFYPVIINIAPVANMAPMLLGMLDAEADSNDLSYQRGLHPVDRNRISAYIREEDLEYSL